MAYLRNRGTKNEPNWYARFKDSDGKWKERPTHQPTKEAARRYVAEVEGRVSRGLIGLPEPTPADLARKALTVAQLARRFLGEVDGCASYAPPRIKSLDNYRRDARSVVNARILPALGSRAAVSVTMADAEAFRDAMLARHLAGATVTQTLAILSKLYNWGRKAGLVDCINPVGGVERPRCAASLDYLSRGEVYALLARAEELATGDGATWEAWVRWAMVATAVHCGLRKGEMFGLRWSDVDLDAGRLTVARSYALLPKSNEVRHLPIHPDLARVLRVWRRRNPHAAGGLVFPVEPVPGRFRMGMKNDELAIVDLFMEADCHLPADGKPWHMMRHTFAAHAVMSGASLYAVQRLLGHSSPTMTQRYAHLAPDYMAQEVARMSFAPPPPAGVVDLGEKRRQLAMEGDVE